MLPDESVIDDRGRCGSEQQACRPACSFCCAQPALQAKKARESRFYLRFDRRGHFAPKVTFPHLLKTEPSRPDCLHSGWDAGVKSESCRPDQPVPCVPRPPDFRWIWTGASMIWSAAERDWRRRRTPALSIGHLGFALVHACPR